MCIDEITESKSAYECRLKLHFSPHDDVINNSSRPLDRIESGVRSSWLKGEKRPAGHGLMGFAWTSIGNSVGNGGFHSHGGTSKAR